MSHEEDTHITTFRASWFNYPEKMPMITVFYNTADYPEKYVARLFFFEKPTEAVAVRDTLSEIRDTIPEWMTRLERSENDDPVIVEVWL